MNAPNHAAAKAAMAAGGIAAVLVVCEAANLAGRHLGVIAGVAVIVAVFAACWLVHLIRPMLRPVSRRPREPQVTSPAALAESQQSARIAA